MSIHKDSYMGKMRVSKQIVLLSPSMASWHAQDGPWLHLHQTYQPLRYLPLQQPPWTMLPSWVLALVTLELHRCSPHLQPPYMLFPLCEQSLHHSVELWLWPQWPLQTSAYTCPRCLLSLLWGRRNVQAQAFLIFTFTLPLRWFSSFPNTDWAEHALLQPAPYLILNPQEDPWSTPWGQKPCVLASLPDQYLEKGLDIE